MRKKWVLCNILGVMERIIQSTHLVLSFRERRVAQGTVRGVNCDSLSFELEMPKKDSASRARFEDRSHELLRWTQYSRKPSVFSVSTEKGQSAKSHFQRPEPPPPHQLFIPCPRARVRHVLELFFLLNFKILI